MFVNTTQHSFRRPLVAAAGMLVALTTIAFAEDRQPAGAPEPPPDPAVADQPATNQPANDQPVETAHTRVRLETSVGDIELELFDDKSPLTVANFVRYVRDGFYDGLVFHRVIPGYIVQAGGHTADLAMRTEGLRPPIKNESANLLKNERGTVAMARLSDPHSATSQFFINLADNPNLDRTARQPYGYAVFGKIVAGMDVVDRIASAPCVQHPNDPRKGEDGPVNPDPPIVIKRAVVIEVEAAEADQSKGESPDEQAEPSEPRP